MCIPLTHWDKKSEFIGYCSNEALVRIYIYMLHMDNMWHIFQKKKIKRNVKIQWCEIFLYVWLKISIKNAIRSWIERVGDDTIYKIIEKDYLIYILSYLEEY